MKVVIAKSAGFCRGVRLAVEKARAMLHHSDDSCKSKNAEIYTDGPLIHNSQMLASLHAEGILECNNIESLQEDILLIRAHGIAPDRRKMLNSLPISLVDATCPDVARIQGQIRKYTRIGYHILIFGDAGHPEVTGLLGYAEGKGHLLSTTDDVKSLPELQPFCLVAQSTQFATAFDEIAESVLNRFPDCLVLDTICPATKQRQNELLELVQSTDAIVVIGDKASANTMRLVELAKKNRPTFHIQTAEQLKPKDFTKYNVIGLTAGASTPDFIIKAIHERLTEI